MTAGFVPIDPPPPEARQWLVDELGKPQYAAAKPSWFDQAATAVRDWLFSLTAPSDSSLGGLLPLLAAIVIVALIVVAFVILGRPRRRRRQVASAVEPLFGSDDRRTAAQLRASAAAAAAAGDYRTAIEELYRALARRQSERTIVRVSPGTTAHGFALQAGGAYPGHVAGLTSAARTFDSVRYLGGRATREGYEQLVGLELELRDLAPRERESVGGWAGVR